MPLTPDNVEILDAAGDRIRQEIHTGAIGKVLAYHAATQTVDVQVVWNPPMPDRPDQPVVFEALPALGNVPVAFPRAQGFVFTVPLAAGDYVVLVFMEHSIAGWRQSGDVSDAQDTRKHSLSYPLAIPGIVPDSAAAAMADKTFTGVGMLIGKDGDQAQIRITPGLIQLGATGGDFVALASKVDACMAAIKSHTHTFVYSAGPTSGTPGVTVASSGLSSLDAGGVGSTLIGAQ